ncbi:hypothetical protein H6G97_26500 [Nostoc flagelliforme FACHB-838]|uniref:Replication protein O n=1 Tax=Nostoc flagelliforme FACHB-838 TaxID=2692904 RepID=A0ABR8DXF1_9NOSO|nr:hypothetical protein [Nostoc flagelliforme]MBD2532935.1 hypothetical protein [Nostoc flagelliforme FACHB-838]
MSLTLNTPQITSPKSGTNCFKNQASFLAWESRSRDTIEVKRCYVDVAGGDLIAGILLSQIIYWHLPDHEGQSRLRIERDGYKWLAKKRDDWWKECRITPRQFDLATKLLQSKNLIKTATYKFGNSPIKHIRIDWENFLNELQAVVQSPPDAPERIKTTFTRSDQNGNLTKCQSLNLQNGELELTKMSNLKLTFCQDDLIDTEITSKITSEITHNAPLASPPAPPTQECVCEKEELDLTTEEIELEKPTPEEPTSLLKKSESSQQTDNPSRGSTIAAASFDKSEQANNQLVAPNPKSASPTSLPDSTCYTMHPTEKTEQAMRESGLPPWMDKAGPNGWKAEFVESYRQYLNSTPRYAKELIRQATTGEAKNALTRLSKTDSGKAEIQNHWDSFNELKERQQPTQSKHNANSSNDDVLAMAIAADEERRQQEQSKQERKNEYRFSPQMLELKAKLQAAASSAKVPSNTRPSSTNLREVEAQLKLALRA